MLLARDVDGTKKVKICSVQPMALMVFGLGLISLLIEKLDINIIYTYKIQLVRFEIK